MRKMLYILLILSSRLYSQNPTSNSKFYNIDIKSPGITDFMKYGNMSSLSYTGSLDFSIPLIAESSINLNYDSSGFRPSKRSGLVGLNWYLNMGGAITREVNGMPDDQMGEPYSNGARKETNGFIVGIRNRIHSRENVFNFNSSDGFENMNLDYYLFGTDINKNYEGDPDIFSFNFDGVTGKFFMGNDGLIKVITNKSNNLKIDITGMQNQFIADDSKPNESLIIITDNSGNKYYFGGLTRNLEYTANGAYPIITTWHLYKIEYYNGKITNFVFRDDSALSPAFDTPGDNDPFHNGFPNYPLDPIQKNIRDFCVMHEYVSDQRYIYQVSNYDPFFGSTGSNSSSDGIQMSTTLQKIAILDQINSDDFVINFTYTRQLHKFNTANSTSINNKNKSFFKDFLDIKLDKIELFNKTGNAIGSLIKTINFGYSYFGGTVHSRMFLTTLKETGKPPYRFNYFNTNNLPLPITYGIDHWGFWNGKSENDNDLIPYQNYQINGDYSDCSNTSNSICSVRNPNFNYTLSGILQKVNYPTGGFTRFEFEQNDYSKRLEVKSVNDYIPALYDATNLGGGLRIKRIVESSDGVTETNEKIYEYKNDLGQSSGVLLSWPRYALSWKINSAGGGFQEFVYIRSNPIGRHILDGPILTYFQVTEKTISNGKKIIKFTDFISNPDDFNSNFRDHLSGSTATPKNLARNYTGLFLNDRSIERGKLSWEKVYDAGNNLVQQTNYVYNSDAAKINNWSTKLHLSGPSVQANKIYYYTDYLTKKTTTSYSSTGDVVNIENSTYISAPSYNPSMISNQDVLSKTSSTNSLNEIVEKEYKYPWQSYLATSTEFFNFKNANIFLPLRETTTKNSIKLNETFTVFAKDASTSNLLLPKFSYSAKFPNNFVSVTDVGTLEKKVTYNSYDNKGNVTQYTPENGVPVALIWGYNQTQPIAKIENATYSSLQSQATNLQTVSNSGTEENLITALNNLRASLPNALVTTYTYKPLIGVSTITDPKGDKITYSYDSFGRLQSVTDKDGNVLSENQYNYRTN